MYKRQHFFALLCKIEELFPGIPTVCLTNGRKFQNVKYARKILSTDANLEIAISLHASKQDVHEKITGVKGSFKETLKGIENVYKFKKKSHKIEIRIVIHALNYKLLEDTVGFIHDRFPYIDRLVLIFFEIEGQAEKNFKVLKLRYSQVSPYIQRLFHFFTMFREVRLYHFPLCAVPPLFYPVSYTHLTLPTKA